MAADHSEIGETVATLHEEVPRTVQVSLTMSKDTRDLLAEIRDQLNESAETPVLETNDVIRLALVGATRYDDLDVSSSNDDRLAPLLETLATAVRADPNLSTELKKK
ncbi:MAG: hypothetical protein ACQEQJ_00320 [Halobacteriota archaeon]